MTGAVPAAAGMGDGGTLHVAWHELRTPVLLIREAARLLDADPATAGRDDRRALEVILRQAEALQRVLDTIAPVAPASSPAPARPTTPLAPVLAAVGAEVADLPASRPLEVDGDTDVCVAVPPGDLHLVLLNIVANAARYALGGTAVRVRVSGNEDHVVTTVSNASAPIPASVRDSLFEPYSRYGASPPTGSSGLGLPIARGLAQAHGGDVQMHIAGTDPTEVTVAVSLPTAGRR